MSLQRRLVAEIRVLRSSLPIRGHSTKGQTWITRDIMPERYLWTAVIRRAVQDLHSDSTAEAACRWFESKDFIEVCNVVNVSAIEVLAHIVAYARAWTGSSKSCQAKIVARSISTTKGIH